MGRADRRLLIGALCGLALILASSFLLRHDLHWSAVWRWVLAPRRGLMALTVAGLVCQLGGVVLVVAELTRASWRLGWLDHWFGELGKLTDAIDPEAMAQEEAAKQNKSSAQGVYSIGAELVTPIYAAYLANWKQLNYLFHVTSILRTYSELPRLRPAAPAWIGPTLLLLGIVFTGAAGMMQLFVAK
ncbi:hypothetical protein A9W94_22705 [Mycobacterium asiaticum]|nr:hypothetical protein A9W94_22705 [Mycobacterium asiaticum]